jgi:hypothetical protein
MCAPNNFPLNSINLPFPDHQENLVPDKVLCVILFTFIFYLYEFIFVKPSLDRN